jgi:hypothetical protein
MCFVTYLPYQQGFVLTSNRDEHVERPKALPPKNIHLKVSRCFILRMDWRVEHGLLLLPT